MHTTQSATEALMQLLAPQYGEPEARSIIRIIFEDGLGLRLPFPHTLTTEQQNTLTAYLPPLGSGVPVQYVLSKALFCGLYFEVGPDVLIPRQETEELVHLVAEAMKSRALPSPRILDIGTGSGCIPVALKHLLPAAEVTACDISTAALDIAARNAAQNGTPVTLVQADVLRPESVQVLPHDLDAIVSNPPYIPPSEKQVMPPHVLDHEPHLALFVPQDDALLFYREIAMRAKTLLKRGGLLFFECNEYRAAEVAALLRHEGFSEVAVHTDLFGKARMVAAEWR